jgi:hypothetical protein
MLKQSNTILATPKLNMRRLEEINAWLFVLPVLLGILIFQVFPVFFSFFASLTDWNLITPPVWVGLDNDAVGELRIMHADPSPANEGRVGDGGKISSPTVPIITLPFFELIPFSARL